jgi:hypothetical protein
MCRIIAFGILCLVSGLALKGQSGVISAFDSYTATGPDKVIPIKGYPFYFDSLWLHARVVSADNKIVQNDSFYYRFNKLDQSLQVSRDFKTAFEVDKREFKSVTFFWNDSVYLFEHAYAINKDDFFLELIREDQAYSLYKFILTTVHPMDLRSNGMVTEGRTYVELIDHPVYYIVFPNQEFRMISDINPKTLEHAFRLTPAAEKVNNYLASHTSKIYNEDFLVGLIMQLDE